MQRGVWLSDPVQAEQSLSPKKGANMPHAIVIGANGRRHEVDFEDAEVTIEVCAGETTIEIVIESRMILRLLIANGLPFSACRAMSFRQPWARPLKE